MNAVRAVEAEARTCRTAWRLACPTSPSTPPVIDDAWFAASDGQQPDPERHHQARQIRAGHHQEADRVAERARDEAAAAPSPESGSAQPCAREQARRVRADAEERGVSERQDARVAEDQIERQREAGRR